MLLASADTKSSSKPNEEISSDHNNHDELSSSNDGSTRADDLANEQPVSSVKESLASDRHISEASTNELMTLTSGENSLPNTMSMTQLSVSPEEDSAFKSYINAHDDNGGHDDDHQDGPIVVADRTSNQLCDDQHSNRATIELRLLVRRREAGALIGKKGANIKRMRETFRSSIFSIPDSGNGPERVVCITSDPKSIEPILADIARLLMEKSPENDEQVELKLLIHSSHAGSIIGIGGQSIKKLRNESKAAIKIYEMCCPLSNERVCAIKAKPPIVVSTIQLIQSILGENPIKGTIKPYDALHFDLALVDKYGGYLPEEPIDLFLHTNSSYAKLANESACHSQRLYGSPGWIRPGSAGLDYCDPYEIHAHESLNGHLATTGEPSYKHRVPLSSSPQAANLKGGQQQASTKSPHQVEPSGAIKLNLRRSPSVGRSAGASRFHPYAAAAATNGSGCHNPASLAQNYPSHRYAGHHPSRYPAQSALHYPSSFPAAALIAAANNGHNQPQPRNPYAHHTLQGHPPHHYQHTHHRASGPPAPGAGFLYPPNSGPGSCRQMRPCLCMFLPMMHDHHPTSCGQLTNSLELGDQFESFHGPSSSSSSVVGPAPTTTDEFEKQQQDASSSNINDGKNK